jgi:hypothetical protein
MTFALKKVETKLIFRPPSPSKHENPLSSTLACRNTQGKHNIQEGRVDICDLPVVRRNPD